MSDPNYDMFTSLQGEGAEVVTAPTRNSQESAVRKLLHPPSAVPGFDGLPTNDARTQVLLQYANTSINKTPFALIGGTVTAFTAANLTTFNIGVLSMNGLRVLDVPFIYDSVTGQYQQDLNNVGIQDSYDSFRFAADAQLYRPCYKSITAQLNATAFNDTGIVTANQFNPNILFAGTLLTLAKQDYELLNHFVMSEQRRKLAVGETLIIDRRHPDRHHHACKFSMLPLHAQAELRRHIGMDSDDVLDLDPNTTIQIVNFGQTGDITNACVPTASQLLNQSARSYTGRARDGAFSVQRLNTVSPGWLASSNTSHTLAPPAHGLYQCYWFILDEALVPHVVPFVDNAAVGTLSGDVPILLDTLWSKDMTWSWTLFEGLSLNSQTSVSTQLLIRKIYTGYEVQPAPNSAWAGLTRLAPPPNLTTMQAVMDGFYELKDSMPAKYNFWGTIGTILGPSLLKAGGSIIDWLTNKVSASSKTSNSSSKPERPRKIKPPAPSLPTPSAPPMPYYQPYDMRQMQRALPVYQPRPIRRRALPASNARRAYSAPPRVAQQPPRASRSRAPRVGANSARQRDLDQGNIPESLSFSRRR